MIAQVHGNLSGRFQSGFRRRHSTETALLLVANDILSSNYSGIVTALVLLDLSAAFDTVDHQILLDRLASRVGLEDETLAWFKSYLSERVQAVSCCGQTSSSRPVTCGVPQGSVLGPLLFSVYTEPLEDVIKAHNIGYHFYADDTQLYLSFKPSEMASATDKLNACLADIRNWMSDNFLKLNDDKTELLLIGHPKRTANLADFTINIGGAVVRPSPCARNLGVLFDSGLTFNSFIQKTASTAVLHIRSLARIRDYLPQWLAKDLVNSLVLSRLDYCNSLLAGLPKNLLSLFS